MKRKAKALSFALALATAFSIAGVSVTNNTANAQTTINGGNDAVNGGDSFEDFFGTSSDADSIQPVPENTTYDLKNENKELIITYPDSMFDTLYLPDYNITLGVGRKETIIYHSIAHNCDYSIEIYVATGATVDSLEKGGVTYEVNDDNTVSVVNINQIKPNVVIEDKVNVYGTWMKVTSIEDEAAEGMSKISKITVGKNISKIGNNALKGCKKLKNITIKSTSIQLGKNVFKNINKNATFYLTSGTKSDKNKITKAISDVATGYVSTMKIVK